MKFNSKLGLILIFLIVFGKICLADNIQGELYIFHAGSLTLPFLEIEKSIEQINPMLDIKREPAGSIKCARKVSELKKPCDIMASSDYRVIDKLLIPEYASWNIKFATNQIVLCFTDSSKYGKEINSNNWMNILRKKDVSWGYADPNIDPCGYRSLMTMQLAEIYYKSKGLYEKLLKNCPKENIRPKSEDQIALLQTGNLDYAWEYFSIAKQHKLKYIELPEEINLSNYKFDKYYEKAKVKVAGKSPGEFIEITGKSITYGITIINNSANFDAATTFLEFLLSPEKGLKTLNDMGQPPLVPCVVSSEDIKMKLPAKLQKLVKVE